MGKCGNKTNLKLEYLGIEMHLIIRIVLALIIKWDNLLSVPAHISLPNFLDGKEDWSRDIEREKT